MLPLLLPLLFLLSLPLVLLPVTPLLPLPSSPLVLAAAFPTLPPHPTTPPHLSFRCRTLLLLEVPPPLARAWLPQLKPLLLPP